MSLLPYVVPGAGGIFAGQLGKRTDEMNIPFPGCRNGGSIVSGTTWLRDTEMLNLVLEDAVLAGGRGRFGAPDQGEPGFFPGARAASTSYSFARAAGLYWYGTDWKRLRVGGGWPKLKRWEQHLRREVMSCSWIFPYTWEYGTCFPVTLSPTAENPKWQSPGKGGNPGGAVWW